MNSSWTKSLLALFLVVPKFIYLLTREIEALNFSNILVVLYHYKTLALLLSEEEKGQDG